MALSRSFKETIQARAIRDPEFRTGLLTAAIECLLENDLCTAKKMLRDYVNAATTFEALSDDIGTPAKSLMRMLSDQGNPRVENLAAMIAALGQHEGISLKVTAQRLAKRTRKPKSTTKVAS